jgi:hypothetical protein
LFEVFGNTKKMIRLREMQFASVGIDTAGALQCDLSETTMIDQQLLWLCADLIGEKTSMRLRQLTIGKEEFGIARDSFVE